MLRTEWRTASRDKLITELERQQHEIERLRREHERADQDRNRYRQQRDQLQRKIDRLEDELGDARRALHRQAAPFSRGTPVIRKFTHRRICGRSRRVTRQAIFMVESAQNRRRDYLSVFREVMTRGDELVEFG